MKLIKKIEMVIDGFEGQTNIGQTEYSVGIACPKNDHVITQEEVVEADEVFLSYVVYQDLGEITLSEVEILQKFKIV